MDEKKINLTNGNGLSVLITGGSRGIGLGIVRELSNAGYKIAINGVRDPLQVDPVINELKKTGGEIFYIRGDISKKEDRLKIFNETIAKFGELNVLINNAGVAPRERLDILEAKEEIFDEVMGINLKGPYFLTQLFANHMIEIKKSNPDFFCSIINVTSVSATLVSVNRGEYCISKAGLAMATKLWAVRLGEFNIPVYEIRPGVIKTDMTATATDKYNRLFEEGINIQKRWGTPEDVGKVALALLQGLLPYSTGQVISVDGGMTIKTL